MAHDDFQNQLVEQLLEDIESKNKEIKELRLQKTESDEQLLESHRLNYHQMIRLKNCEEVATEAQKKSGSIVGKMQHLIPQQSSKASVPRNRDTRFHFYVVNKK